jgi:bifunctional DNA-binding transcriptional regulator/antitoxin component of YhaV-PrlF toxin-antitoxin module
VTTPIKIQLDESGQLVLDAEAMSSLGLAPGETVEVSEVAGGILVRRADDAWFWTPEWQAKEREADEDIAAGRVRHFESDEEFLASLKPVAKNRAMEHPDGPEGEDGR